MFVNNLQLANPNQLPVQQEASNRPGKWGRRELSLGGDGRCMASALFVDHFLEETLSGDG